MYNKTLESVRVTTVAVVKQKYYVGWMCVCSFIYPGCKGHALYYTVLCGFSSCTLFCHICHKGNDFRKKSYHA